LLLVHLEIALAKRFQETYTSYTIKVGSLEMDGPYLTTLAERFVSRFGPTVLLSIRDSAASIKEFLIGAIASS
jgi:hypothetical protein